jgi:hypothetical protein
VVVNESKKGYGSGRDPFFVRTLENQHDLFCAVIPNDRQLRRVEKHNATYDVAQLDEYKEAHDILALEASKIATKRYVIMES